MATSKADEPGRKLLQSGARLWSWQAQQLQHGTSAPIKLAGLKQWMAISRVNIYWAEPHFGDSASGIPAETQLLLWQDRKQRHHVAIPLCSNDFRASISGHQDGIAIVWDNGLDQRSEHSEPLLYMRPAGKNQSAHELIHASMREVSSLLGSFRLREDKTTPDFIDYFGWCTWDAFYHSVDHKKIKRGLKSFRDGGIQLGHVIVDDGMLPHDNDEMLNSFSANPEKFPKGIAATARMAKEEFGLHSFGIWHAFQGYWRGIAPDSDLGKAYASFPNKGRIRPWEGADKHVSLQCIDPQDILRFYFDFYRYLKAQGVDMCKVDNQSALERFTAGKRGRNSSMRAFQEAFQGAGQHFFDGNILHCMSMGSDVGMNMFSSNAYRNSDDYFPKKDKRAQQHHIFVNAFNATLSSHFSYPDWDMFQSHSPCPEFHAAARAISGGPVYVCDYPGKQQFDILHRLVLHDGSVLRCPQPALVCDDDLYTNPETNAQALKLFNHNGDILILGLFHCYHGDEDLLTDFSVSDHPHAKQITYACYRFEAETLQRCKAKTVQQCLLSDAAHEIIICAPIIDGIAALGLLDKYNGSAAILKESRSKKIYTCQLRSGSKRIGFYCENKPKSVSVNGKKRLFRHDTDKMLEISAPINGICEVALTF